MRRQTQPVTPEAVPDPELELAAHLRHLADEVERGEVSRVRVTVIRPGGRIERLGDIPDVLSLV
jgi:hypothetical protein